MNKPNGVDWNAVFEQLRGAIEEQRKSIESLERIAHNHNDQLNKIIDGIGRLSDIARSHEDRILRLEEGRGGKAQ